MNPWKRHITLITKGLATPFMTHVHSEQLCISNPITQGSSQFSSGLTFAEIMESPPQNSDMPGPLCFTCAFDISRQAAAR